MKLNSQKTKIVASGPVTSWQIKGKEMIEFILRGSKITVDSAAAMKLKDACSLEGKIKQT